MSRNRQYVAAIAVVDLARELKRHSVIGLAQIRDIDQTLADQVEALERGDDISGMAEMRYPEAWMITLWQLVDASHADIGARIGATVSPEARGLLANMMLHCENLQEVLDTYLGNIVLTNASESWKTSRVDGQVELTFSFPPGKPYPRCAVERSVVAMYCWAQYLCGREIPLRAVMFAFPAPAHAEFLASLFPCDIWFDSDRHAIVVDESVFSWALPQRNRYVKAVFEQKVAGLEISADVKSLSQQVRELLAKDLPVYQHADRTAQALCMSRTTLYRKLKEEGASFSNILDKARQQLQQRHQHKQVSELCDLLGFGDASAYYKARKRWRAQAGIANDSPE